MRFMWERMDAFYERQAMNHVECFLCGWKATGDKAWVKKVMREHLTLPRHQNAILKATASPLVSSLHTQLKDASTPEKG